MILVALVLAVLPGIHAYIRGRPFLKADRDDDFYGLYFKYQQRCALVFWLCLILIVGLAALDPALGRALGVFQDSTLGLGVILLYAAIYLVYVTGFSLIDRVVRDDRLNIIGRLTFNLRLLFLMFWPYLLLSLAAFGRQEHYQFRALGIAALFCLMYFFSPHFWRVLLGGRGIQDPKTTDKLRAIARQAGLAPVPCYVFSAAGLKFANAFAVGTWGGAKGIFMSEYAYQNLSPAEQLGIFSHEIGHLKRHQTARRSLALLLPLTSVVVLTILFPRAMLPLAWVSFLLALVLIKALVPGQKFEREADLFAGAATADTDGVIAGLQRIHQLGILPRRFSLADERKISHPSLVRRIKYLRQQSGQPLPRLVEERGFAAAAGAVRAVFKADAFVVETGKNQFSAVAYEDIQAMYLQARKEGCLLVVKYRGRAKPFKLPLRAACADLAPVIETVEYGFNDQPAVDFNQFRRAYYIMGALMAFFGLILSIFAGPALFVLGVTGLAVRTKWFYLSYSCGSAVMMLAALLQPWPAGRILVFVLGLCVLIGLADFSRFRHADEEDDRRSRFLFYAGVGLLAVQTIVLVLIAAARMPAGTAVLYRFVFLNLAALSAGLAAAGDWRRNRRRACLGLAAVELLIFALGVIRL